MAIIGTELSMSLDGFIADPADNVGPLFDWYNNGPVELTMPRGDMPLRVSEGSAGFCEFGSGEAQAQSTPASIVTMSRRWIMAVSFCLCC